MIHRVADQNKRLLGEVEPIERPSMNKSAMDSFSKVVVASAKALIAKGETLDAVAAKFKLSSKVLGELIDSDLPPKLACACDSEVEKTASGELDEYEMNAMQAYNDLHNIKGRETPSLPTSSSKRILSNKGNYVTDVGGPQKQIGSQRNNSIWDADVVARQSKTQSNDEILQARNQQIAAEREAAKLVSRYQTIDGKSIADKLKEVDQRKDAGIRSASAQEAHKYNNKLPMNGISIFDTAEFERVPEQTAGEQRRSELKTAAAKPKDRSWVEDGAKTVTSADILNSFVDSMLGKKGK